MTFGTMLMRAAVSLPLLCAGAAAQAAHAPLTPPAATEARDRLSLSLAAFAPAQRAPDLGVAPMAHDPALNRVRLAQMADPEILMRQLREARRRVEAARRTRETGGASRVGGAPGLDAPKVREARVETKLGTAPPGRENSVAGATPRQIAPKTAAPKTIEPASTGRADIALDLKDNMLTLNADGAALGDVLRAIAEVAAFETTLSGDLTAPVEASFTRMPVDEALKRLLRGITHAEQYHPAEPGRADRRVREAWVLGPRTPIVSKPPVIGNTPDADAPGA